ncbi:hypothetical protein WJX73_010883 [Symbiochloris irregularis]|uniref:Uncharacterized protein n=1 Tax=Symbiochloris irregularis TaxID=706552 RepID=A0AAW1PJK5_9CHLO
MGWNLNPPMQRWLSLRGISAIKLTMTASHPLQWLERRLPPRLGNNQQTAQQRQLRYFEAIMGSILQTLPHVDFSFVCGQFEEVIARHSLGLLSLAGNLRSSVVSIDVGRLTRTSEFAALANFECLRDLQVSIKTDVLDPAYRQTLALHDPGRLDRFNFVLDQADLDRLAGLSALQSLSVHFYPSVESSHLSHHWMRLDERLLEIVRMPRLRCIKLGQDDGADFSAASKMYLNTARQTVQAAGGHCRIDLTVDCQV